jgi:hypothetical protein
MHDTGLCEFPLLRWSFLMRPTCIVHLIDILFFSSWLGSGTKLRNTSVVDPLLIFQMLPDPNPTLKQSQKNAKFFSKGTGM